MSRGRPRKPLAWRFNRHHQRMEWIFTHYGPDGTRVTRWLGPISEAEAKRIVAEAEGLAAEHRRLAESPIVANKIDEFIELRQPYWQPETLRYYRSCLRAFAAFLESAGVAIMASLETLEIRAYLPHLKRQGLAQASINSRLRGARAFLRFYDLDVQAKRLQPVKVRERIRPLRVLTNDESQALLDAASGDMRDAVLVLLMTGIRRGELISLAWSQVDLEHRVLRVKGKSGERVIGMTEALHDLLARRERKCELIFTGWRDGHAFSWQFKRLVTKAKISHCSVHDLRRTVATRLFAAGVSESMIKAQLGHVSIDTTMISYVQIDDRQRRQAMEILELPGVH